MDNTDNDSGQCFYAGKKAANTPKPNNSLKPLGYTQVAIFKGGWKEWTDAGLPEERTPWHVSAERQVGEMFY